MGTRRPFSLERLYWRRWLWCARINRVLWPLRVNIILAAIAWLAVGAVDQAQDAQRVIVDEVLYGGVRLRFFVTVLACCAVAGNIWFWSRTTLNILYPRGLRHPLSARVATWAPRLLGVVPALAMAYACADIALNDSERPGAFVGASFTWVAVAALLMASYVARRRLLEKFQRSPSAHPSLLERLFARASAPTHQDAAVVRRLDAHLPNRLSKLLLGSTGLKALGPGAQVSLICGFIVGLLLLFFAVVAPGFAAGFDALGLRFPIGPLATVLLGLAIWVVILHPVLIISVKGRFPIVLVLLATFGLAGYLGWNENHAVRFRRTAAPPILPLETDFERWIAERATHPHAEFPVFILATEGGGIRAAYFTALALAKLDNDVPGFRKHLYAVSGVSGGSVGAAFYSTFLRNQELAGPVPGATTLTQQVQDSLKRDLLSPVLARAFTSDLAIEAVPWVPDLGPSLALPDRARALEVAAEDAAASVLGKSPRVDLEHSFYGLRPAPDGDGVANSNVPALILNATRVETGERIVVSHVRLDNLVVPVGAGPSAPADPHLAPRDLQSLRDNDLRTSTAAFLSARFPIVTPVASFDARDPRLGSATVKHRLADGGYFENSGTATALNVVSELVRVIRSAPADSVVGRARIHVIQIRFLETSAGDAYAFDELASPLRTMLHTREARGEYSRDLLEHVLARVANPPGTPTTPGALSAAPTRGVSPDIIRFEYQSESVPIPLGWALSTPACRSMEDQLGIDNTGRRAAAKVADATAHASLTRDLNEHMLTRVKQIMDAAR
jgi:hypothetical protein